MIPVNMLVVVVGKMIMKVLLLIVFVTTLTRTWEGLRSFVNKFMITHKKINLVIIIFNSSVVAATAIVVADAVQLNLTNSTTNQTLRRIKKPIFFLKE